MSSHVVSAGDWAAIGIVLSGGGATVCATSLVEVATGGGTGAAAGTTVAVVAVAAVAAVSAGGT
jgi:hypothetical protein